MKPPRYHSPELDRELDERAPTPVTEEPTVFGEARNAKSERYPEREWRVIAAAVRRVPFPVPVDTTRLRDTLEQLRRNYAFLSMDRDYRKFFVAQEKTVAEFRRQIAEEDRLPLELRLPPELRQRLADALGEAERFRQEHNTCARHKTPRSQNARKAALESYCTSLLSVWVSLGGDWWSRGCNTKAAKDFIIACAQPVVGKKVSMNSGALDKRLQRLVNDGITVVITFQMPDGRLEQCPIPLRSMTRRKGRRRTNEA